MAKAFGVASGDSAWECLQQAATGNTAIPVYNGSTYADCVQALEAGRELGKPIAIQFDCAECNALAGNTLDNDVFQGSQLGAVMGAHIVRWLAPAYGVKALCHTTAADGQQKFVEGLLDVDADFVKTAGEPLFSSHTVPGGEAGIVQKCQALGIPMQLDGAAPSSLARVFGKGALQGSSAAGGALKVGVYSSRKYDEATFLEANLAANSPLKFEFHFLPLNEETVHTAKGCYAVCVFVNDDVNAATVKKLGEYGVKAIALRCAGFSNVELFTAQSLGMKVARVPAYSPHAVAEHAVALMLSLNRKIPQAWLRTKSNNFDLNGLLGFDMLGKRVGIVGTGQIGYIAAKILKLGFDCEVVAYDVFQNPKIKNPEPEGLGIEYVDLDTIWSTCDIISLHAPLMPATYRMVNEDAIKKMKDGVMIINCARGALIHSRALLQGMKTKKIGAIGLDVYEEESNYFFHDHSHMGVADDIFGRLLTFPNTMVTAHQAFFTKEAMNEIAKTTVANIAGISADGAPPKQRGVLDTNVAPPPGAKPEPPKQETVGRQASKTKLMTKRESMVALGSLGGMGALGAIDPAGLARSGSKQAAAAGRIKVVFFSCKGYDKKSFEGMNKQMGGNLQMVCHDVPLSESTAPLAAGAYAVCAFVNDEVDTECVEALAGLGVKVIAMRCAGFNNVDFKKAAELGVQVCRVPAYSPYAVAEHAIALMTSLNRKLPQAWSKTRSGNFSLDGQMGFDMVGKRVGIVGTGQIGYIAARILKRGYDCEVVAYDVFQNPKIKELGIEYVDLDTIWSTCDIISLHAPLMPATHHMLNDDAVSKMKKGAVIINCARGGLIDTRALLNGLKSGIIGGAGLDVYEEESDYFFQDCSNEIMDDDVFARLLSFPTVIVTAHQAFFTQEALDEIAKTTVNNIVGLHDNGEAPLQRGVLDPMVKPK